MSDKKPESINLDLIQMVQKARMMHDNEAIPSQVAAVYWIEAKCATNCTPTTPRSGQLMTETTLHEVDALRNKIKSATEIGELGYKSKVSTTSRNRNNPNARTLCIRTYDSTDEADIERIRSKLSELMPDTRWTYEADHKE